MPEEQRVESEQIKGALVVAFVLEQQEVLLPEGLVITLVDQRTLVDRWQELAIARLPDKPNILPPIVNRIGIGHILIQCNLHIIYSIPSSRRAVFAAHAAW